MKTKLKLSPKVKTKNILVFTCTGIVGALLISIGAFFYFNFGNSSASNAATTTAGEVITSVNSGNWDTPSGWDKGRKPENGDRVIIKSGHEKTINRDTNFNGDIIINGELKILNARLKMDEDSRVAVNVGGAISFSLDNWRFGWPPRVATGYITIGGSNQNTEVGPSLLPLLVPHGRGGTIVAGTTTGPAHFGPDAESLLPIELLTFNAQLTTAGDVDITWSTAAEKDNDFFTIERSLDGQNFFVLDTLGGAGNSHTLREYTYTDAAPVAGYNYYRLKQTDYDGKFEYFDMVTVVNDKAKPELSMISIGPNPYRDQFEVSFYSIDNNAVHLKLMDMRGKTIFSKSLEAEKGLNSYTYVDQSNLQPGIYLFTIVQKGTPAKTFRVVKSS